jgi:serine/threonine protein kinase
MTSYEIRQVLGKGAFGKVVLAVHKLTQKQVALKIINKKTLSTS